SLSPSSIGPKTRRAEGPSVVRERSDRRSIRRRKGTMALNRWQYKSLEETHDCPVGVGCSIRTSPHEEHSCSPRQEVAHDEMEGLAYGGRLRTGGGSAVRRSAHRIDRGSRIGIDRAP